MRFKIFGICLLTIVSMMTGFNAAQAGSSTFKTPEVSAKSWTGGYAGVSVGSYEQNVNLEGLDLFADRGYTAGVHAGYDVQLARMVVGVRGSYNWVLDDQVSIGETQNTWDAIVRAGTLITDHTLLYGLVGYGEVLQDDIDDISGWKWGFGLETAVTDKIHVNIEYQQLFEDDANDFDEFFESSGLNATADGTIIRGGVSVRFN